MILRLFRVVVHEGRQAEFETFFRETSIPLVASQPGLVSMSPGLPRPETPLEFGMAMVWRDLDALKAFVGDDWQTAHMPAAGAPLVREVSVSHFDLAEG